MIIRTAITEPLLSGISPQEVIYQVTVQLPELPSVIRYYDDFDDTLRSIFNPETQNIFELHYCGSKVLLAFDQFEASFAVLLKHLFLFLIAGEYSISSLRSVISSFSHISETELAGLLSIKPVEAKTWWAALRAKGYNSHVYPSLKALLRFLCAHHLCEWSPEHLDFISGLPLPSVDKYAAVRSGDVFLSVDEEAAIVHYLDNLAHGLTQSPHKLETGMLRKGGMLLCSYQFGMRPVQIASLTLRDVRVWDEDDEEIPAVHLTFRRVKQRSPSKALPLPRRVKRDWAAIIIEQHRRAKEKGLTGKHRFFEVNSANEVSAAIIALASEITGTEVSATDLRHTAAQRLVDAGASQEELAEFLGHSDITTGLVYYQTSANQAERVNKALGISEVYQRIAKIAHDRFISPDELAELKGEQQIAGVPHGIPIAGIGGCSSGQPACPYNPVTSCYGCRKFMPVTDLAIHQQVLEEMRGVVTFFVEASRGDSHSPAYLQLRRTISSIQQVIAELEEEPPKNA